MISQGTPGQPVPSIWDQTKSFFSEVPLGSRMILIINCTIFIIQFFEPAVTSRFSFYAPAVINNNQWYRMFTSAFIHHGLLHIFFNMLWVCFGAKRLERYFGTIAFMALTITLLVFTGIIMFLIDAGLHYVFGNFPFSEYNSSVAGFSGVLFAFMQILYAGIYPGTHINRCGMQIPAKLAPLLLLVILKVFMSGSSFFGHLSGIIVGQLVNWKILRWFLPSQGCCESADKCLRSCTENMNSYIETSPDVSASEMFGPKPCLTGIFSGRTTGGSQRQEINVNRFEEFKDSDKP